MRILLVAGLWLDADVWNPVAAELRALGHEPVPVALPGQRRGEQRGGVRLADQLEAVVAEIDNSTEPVVAVGHSGASSLVWLAADARPLEVGKAVFIGGFPVADGSSYADFFEPHGQEVPFPGWDSFDGPDSRDLDSEQKRRFEAAAVPVPVGVARGVVQLRDERRFDVPATLICPEFSPDEAEQWLAAGELPELARIPRLELIDLDSGHWPMITQPRRLAEILTVVAAPSWQAPRRQG